MIVIMFSFLAYWTKVTSASEGLGRYVREKMNFEAVFSDGVDSYKANRGTSYTWSVDSDNVRIYKHIHQTKT